MVHIKGEQMNFRCYIAYGGDKHLLDKAIQSLYDDGICNVVPGRPIVVMDNTLQLTVNDLPWYCELITPSDRLLHGQSINAFIRMALKNKEDFVMSLHTDAVVHKGAIQNLIDAYEKHGNKKWGCIVTGTGLGDAFCLWNPQFSLKEDIWHDPFLFPMYYMDNNFYRLMDLRGWTRLNVGENNLITHTGSHSIRNSPVFNMKNNIAFKYHGMIYSEIWGGLPGQETIHDCTARGLFPFPKEKHE